MIEKPSKLQPALVGGLIIGVLWSIPLLNLINCCCIGVLAGGAVAAWMLINRSPVLPVTYGDGAVVGVLAGLVAAGVYLVLGIPISLVSNQATVRALRSIMESFNDPQIRDAMEQAVKNSQDQGMGERLAAAFIGWLFVAAISVGFATLGGLIGVAIFEKRKGQGYPPQAPPPMGYPPSGYTPPGPPPGPQDYGQQS